MVPCLGNYKSQQAPRPRCLVFPGLLEQSLLGNVVLAAQVISAESLVGVILTPTGKRLRPRRGVGGNGRERRRRAEGCWGWGQASCGQRHRSHSALALDPETAAAAEAKAPVPGILARILALMWLN